MSLSRESIIICEPSPSICKVNRTRRWTSKKRNNGGKRRKVEEPPKAPLRVEEYESPLKYLRINGRKRSLSSSKSDIIVIDSPEIKVSKTRLKQKCKRLSPIPITPEDNAALQDSVIIISDSEIESNKADKVTHSHDQVSPLPKEASSILESDSEDLILVECSNITDKHADRTNPVPQVQKGFYRTRASVKKMREEMSKENCQKTPQENMLDSDKGKISTLASKLHLQEKSKQVEVQRKEKNIEPKEASQVSEEIAVIWTSNTNTCLTTKSTYELETCGTSNLNATNEKQTDNSDTSNSNATDAVKMVIDPTTSQNLKSDRSNLHNLNARSRNISRRIRLKNAGKTPMMGKKKMKCLQDMVFNQASISSNNQYSPLSETVQVDCERRPPGSLREIIIDGSNVAFAHTAGKCFSIKGLQLVIDYFKSRGHTVKAFVPHHRRSPCHKILEQLYKQGIVIFTPSRNIDGKMITPYDDRYILEYATKCQGIVISHDRYRDLYDEKPGWKDTINKRLLEPTFVGDYVMFPDDPLGRRGPSLYDFLRH
ncbi:uncharacterized protein LOC107268730 [Cephus cinctus]|uniref:Uncharacterized protein LOC107268730 n=1 Tax=Cephus cinctus TaxID=211228 RepID=A0AAJ7BZB5_CEPCN|nr:uncharacterized protein LOC107268730 [Cephus cinctus]XP_015597263.1 uncharacterized protein LOC107268730 [Cephus cinctus]XP_024941780.1 uncharacterized protein LOC107268730 [Cephus cinctus]XP_024941782.1 uncharacterized protein LOC107268730 [Cephus cinctus]